MSRDPKPVITIIMLAWNRKECVLAGIPKIHKSTFRDYEIIVIDNGSTDGTSESVQKLYPEVNVIRLPENIGINGYNAGFKVAKGKYILCLDDDSYPDENCLEKVVAKFEEEPPQTAILTLKLMNRYPEGQHCGTENWPKNMITFWAGGAAFRKEILIELGGYNEDFFLYRNEMELSIRCYLAGYRIVYYDQAMIIHETSPVNRTSSRAFRYNNRNDIYIFWNYYPLFTGLNYLTKILLFTFVKSIIKYRLRDFLFIWGIFLRKWVWKRRYWSIKNKNRVEIYDNYKWREMNLIQPKLTDIPRRLFKKQLIW